VCFLIAKKATGSFLVKIFQESMT